LPRAILMAANLVEFSALHSCGKPCDIFVVNTPNHRGAHETASENMKNEHEPADSSLSETMVTRIEIEELGDPARQKEITDALEAVEGVVEIKIQKGALHVSFDALATTEKKIEQAIRSTGTTVKTAVADRETPHPDLSTSAKMERAPAKKPHEGKHA
jgi:copper chaperone CopZ